MTFGYFAFITCFLIAIFVSSSHCQVPDCNGCCSNTTYKEINDPRRSTGNVWQKGERTLCDRSLQWGWYRFTSFAGGKMPEGTVDLNHCGTHAPIWLNGPHPTKIGENVARQACINAFGGQYDCWDHFYMNITNCGDYYVYLLRPTSYCSVAYCAGYKPPCPYGKEGEPPNCFDVDDCVTQSCKHSGTCKDGVNTYSCVCQTGFIGVHCETDIDDCVKQPCKNSGTCKDGLNMYTCVCQTGFTGIDCETNIDDCVSNDCANGATCVDGINRYSCTCPEKFTGKLCESNETVTEEPETELVIELRIQRTWDDDLRDKTSKAYKELYFLFEKEILKQFSQDDDLIEVEILLFDPGSVVVEFKLTFKRKLKYEEALAPLKEGIEDGKLGSLRVDPESLKVKKYSEEPTEVEVGEQKIPYKLIIGVSCGGALILALVTICGIRYRQRKRQMNRLHTSDGVPASDGVHRKMLFAMRS